MDYSVFDCNCMFHKTMTGTEQHFSTVDALCRVMDEKGIDHTLVFSAFARANGAGENVRFAKQVASTKRITPCFVALPHYDGECESPIELIAQMRSVGALAVRIFPVLHNIQLDLFMWEELFDALEKENIPLLLDFSNPNWSADFDYKNIHTICTVFPKLPVVIMRVAQKGDRYLYRLLDLHEELYMDTSYYQVNGGISNMVATFSAKRLLFGSGLPFFEPDSPINMILKSDISNHDKALVLSGNLTRLLDNAAKGRHTV